MSNCNINYNVNIMCISNIICIYCIFIILNSNPLHSPSFCNFFEPFFFFLKRETPREGDMVKEGVCVSDSIEQIGVDIAVGITRCLERKHSHAAAMHLVQMDRCFWSYGLIMHIYKVV